MEVTMWASGYDYFPSLLFLLASWMMSGQSYSQILTTEYTWSLNRYVVQNLPTDPHYVCMCSVAQSRLTLCNPMDCSPQALLPMEFSRQEYWNRLSFPTPGDLPNPGIKPTSHVSSALAHRFFTTVPLGNPDHITLCYAMLSHFSSVRLCVTP